MGAKLSMQNSDFLHPNHIAIFAEAASKYDFRILVRETGRAAPNWVGKRGYTGRRGDLKAKTADLNAGRYQTAGLVCSPFLQP